ncbi:MAG TPA: sulfotransferase [Acetobacteraceae bacterium]|nr:sulfotransferase [Acetobacteraceae bacterium]
MHSSAPSAATQAVSQLLAAAAALLRAGQPAAAVAPLRQAAALAPANATIQHDFGLACLESGLHAEAIAALRQAIVLSPRYADAHLRLAIALEAEGDLGAALAAYRRAAELDPTLADARYRAGDLLESLGQTGRAAQSFRRAAAAAPRTTLGRIAAAKALLTENRDDEAEQILREALAAEPDNSAALGLLGTLLADAGNFAQARDCFTRAVECDPSRAGLYYDLVRCRRITPEDAPLLARMRAAATLPGLEPAQRSRVHLALGKAADDLGDPREAMRHFDAAEALRNDIARFDIAAFERRVDHLIAIFTPELMARTGPPRNDAAPILILGLPRSGTTLVEQILATHPAVHAGGELSFWNERGSAWESAGGTAPNGKFLAAAATDYLHLLRKIAPRGERVTDKMPLNFQWAGLIHLAFPRAVILHCTRTEIDTALSIHQTHINPRMKFPTGGSALVAYIRAYRRLAAHWRATLPAGRWLDIPYEQLVADSAPLTRHIIQAADLPWNDACLTPERNANSIKTPSKWQARQAIYRTSVGRWRAYEPWLGPLRALIEDSPSQ